MLTDAPGRGPDWANASVYLAATLAVPLTATAVALSLDVGIGPTLFGHPDERDAVQILITWLPWSVWITLAPYAAWWRWRGRVDVATLELTSRDLSGRSSRPLRRWRSVRLDQLSAVRYRRRFWEQRNGEVYIDGYIYARDTTGARIAVKFTHRRDDRDRGTREALCRALSEALRRSPNARVDTLTLLRLDGQSSRRAVTVGSALSLLLLMLVLLIMLPLAFVPLYQLGAIGPS